MKTKTLLLGFLMILSLAVLAGCAAPTPAASPTPLVTAAPEPTATFSPEPTASPTPEPSAAPESTAQASITLTLEELKAYNGQNGMPAYIAVDGKIYDVTNNPMWRNGTHNGFTAGNDLTEQIKTISPHGLKVLGQVPMVGVIKE